MKISEMNNDQAAAALLRIAGPFANIADDEELMTIWDEIKALKDSGATAQAATLKMVPKFVTFGLQRHKRDIYEIIGAMAGKTNGEVAKMNILETIKVFRENIDDLTTGFFTPSGVQTPKNAGKSSARSTGTAGTDGTP